MLKRLMTRRETIQRAVGAGAALVVMNTPRPPNAQP
jgi:hypothetical protein